MLRSYPHTAELVGLYDLNQTRMSAFAKLLDRAVQGYTDFGCLVARERPDSLIICTPDDTHDDLIELAFSHGLDAIVEKPMATSTAKVQRIFELERKYGRKVRVTFNCRFATYLQHLKRTLIEHPIGEVRSVHLEWFIDQIHGTEYFRRWHATMKRSGGLLVHKSTHHFDIVNWLIEDTPVEVLAMGSLQFYGRSGPFRGANCRTCEHASRCRFCMTTAWGSIKELYFDAEHEDGYLRDRCVFREDIDIYDTMNVAVKYARGAQLSYSSITYAPCEGFRLSLTGTEGRLEAEEFYGGVMLHSKDPISRTRLIRGKTREDVTIRTIETPMDRTEHGGGDDRMYRFIFEPDVPDPLHQNAGSAEGAASCLIGICANRSIETGRIQKIPLQQEIRRA